LVRDIGPMRLLSAPYLALLKMTHRPSIRKGDIVVIRAPRLLVGDEMLLVKRVIAFGGERLRVQGRHVFVDGVLLNEPYALSDSQPAFSMSQLPSEARGGGGEITLGSEEYFVMGDNRDDSFDSRLFGPIHRSDIVGVATLRLPSVRDTECDASR
jgi:signal peptidase I